MCTVTVARLAADNLIVTMNRDELRDRATEQAPKYFKAAVEAIYPIDTQAKGTWCAVNAYGLVFSLLNRYDNIDYHANISRGNIILKLLACENAEDVLKNIQQLNIKQYAPFSLFINGFAESILIHWDGNNLHTNNIENQRFYSFTSSSWLAAEVLPWREQQFKIWLDKGAEHNQQGLPTYNLLQPKNKSDYAPLVSREHSYTKSITQFNLTSDKAVCRYWSENQLPEGKYQEIKMPLDIN